MGLGVTIAIAAAIPFMLWAIRYCTHRPDLPYSWAHRSRVSSLFLLAVLALCSAGLSVALLIIAVRDVASTTCTVQEAKQVLASDGSGLCSVTAAMASTQRSIQGLVLDGSSGLPAPAVRLCATSSNGTALLGKRFSCYYRRSEHQAQLWRPPAFPASCPKYGSESPRYLPSYSGSVWISSGNAPGSLVDPA